MTESEYDYLLRKWPGSNPWTWLGRRTAVTLPSDAASPEELLRRNGPCHVYRLGAPMDIRQFEAMPRDLQRAYLHRLRQRGGSAESVQAMLGISRQRLRQLQERDRIVFDQPDRTAWEAFLRR